MNRNMRSGFAKIASSKIFSLCALSLLGGCKMAIMDPQGAVGASEKNLIITAFVLMLLVVVPVIFMAILFAYKYRATNKKADYQPEWSHSHKIEAVVWGVPCLIVLALSIICWQSTHALDPARPLASTEKPIEIDVVALDWKWLFIYPEQHIAVVNQVAFPANRPVLFVVTSDSVMNSFFIPQLGTQVYAMTGMKARLNLIADKAGTYDGLSSNFSGPGFSGMIFKALALTNTDFNGWVATARRSSDKLNAASYADLVKPTENEPVRYYAAVDPGLFDFIVDHYMGMAMDKNTATKNDADPEGAENVR